MAGKQYHDFHESPVPQQGCLSGLIRLYWLSIGNLCLFFSAIASAKEPSSATMGVLFLGAVVALLLVRFVDIRVYKGQTSEGEPATIAHWRRYALRLVIFSVALWGVVRLAAARGWM